jgi:hypothetical protein
MKDMKDIKYIFSPYDTYNTSTIDVRRLDILDRKNYCLIYSLVIKEFLYRGVVYINNACIYKKDVEQSKEQLEKLKQCIDEVLINIGGIILTEDQLKKYKLLK